MRGGLFGCPSFIAVAGDDEFTDVLQLPTALGAFSELVVAAISAAQNALTVFGACR